MSKKSIVIVLAVTISIVAAIVIGFRYFDSGITIPPADVPNFSTAEMEPQVVEKIQRLRNAVLESPESPRAWSRYARALHAHDVLQQAIDAYRSTSALDADDYRWPYLAGMAERKLNAATALPWFEKAAQLAPTNPAFYINYGDLLVQLGDLQGAVMQYEAALGQDSRSAHAFYGMGQVAMLQGDLDTAAAQLQQGLAIAPHHGESHILLAQVYHRRGEEASATQEEKLASAYPTYTRADDPVVRAMEAEAIDSQAYASRGVSFASKGEYAAAERQFRRVLETRTGGAQDWTNLGGSLAGQGRFEEAIDAYELALELDANNVDTQSNLAMAMMQLDKLDQAASFLEQALSADPDNANAHHNLGLVRAQQGRWPDAEKQYLAALRTNPTHGEALANLGVALMQQGRAAEARDAWARALDSNPLNIPARYNLAVAYAADGDHGNAIRVLDEGVKLAPDVVNMTTLLAWELATAPRAELRDGDRAVMLARNTYDARPRDPRQADVLSAALAEDGQFPEAIVVAEKGLQILITGTQQSGQVGTNNSTLVAGLQRRLSGYKQGVPFHQSALTQKKAGGN